MNKINLFLLLIGVNFASYAMDSIENRQEKLISQLLSQQVQQNISIENSVGSLIKRYPEKVDTILKFALLNYPKKYEEIILGTIRAEPALSAAVVAAVLHARVASCAEVVKIAISAEPAYANEIILAASQNSLDPIQDIVRVAVSTEPFISNSIISNAKNDSSDKMLNIFVGIVKAIPTQVVSLVKQTLLLFPEDSAEVVSTAVSSSTAQFDQKIVDAAINLGVKKEIAMAAAVRGGANRKYFAPL